MELWDGRLGACQGLCGFQALAISATFEWQIYDFENVASKVL